MNRIASRLSGRLTISAGVLFSTVAHADVVVSTAATANMSCSSGVCAPTAKNAVLNVGDLENLLASGNVEVTTTGSRVQARNIEIVAPLSWATGSTLGFDAYQSILIDKQVSVAGQGGLSITTNDGGQSGYFSVRNKGQVAFANLSSALTIDNAVYTLVGDIASLAADIAANSNGNFALANSYDASKDGTYNASPIQTVFDGTFEGLGNTISNLSINDPTSGDYVGFFYELASQAAVESINFQGLTIGGSGLAVGGLVGLSEGSISDVFVSGTLTSDFDQDGPNIGGLAGYSNGSVTRSGAAGYIGDGQAWTSGGGLVGANLGAISQSYANCVIAGSDKGSLGGLVGDNAGPISNSYAIGRVEGGIGPDIGGLAGFNGTTITQAYSGTVLKGVGRSHLAGGLIGVDESNSGSISSTYWDTTSSKFRNLNRGAGSPKDDHGIRGLTSEELEADLPKGFDPTVWAEDPKINKGFPYLIANPPRKD